MIVQFIFNVIATLLGFVFSFLPVITKIPNIVGYDIDTALINGVTDLNLFMDVFFPLRIVMEGFLVLMSYYALKIPIRIVMGSRSPV